jgi:hypothetical protein
MKSFELNVMLCNTVLKPDLENLRSFACKAVRQWHSLVSDAEQDAAI